jgi:hypothetical protein
MFIGKTGVPNHHLPIFVDHNIFLTINKVRWSDCIGEDWAKRAFFPLWDRCGSKKLFKICLDYRANDIILGHNHPSGNIQPCEADQRLTKKIKDCGILLYLAVLDYVIVAGDHYSFAD